MTGTTPRYALPFPANADPPDGPSQIQALAEATEDAIDNPLVAAAAIYRSADQTITTATWTSIIFQNERFDTDGMWAAGDPTRLVAVTAGIYTAGGFCSFEANATGARAARIVKGVGGSALEGLAELSVPGIATDISGAGGNAMNVQTRPFVLEVGDWISFDVFHNRGSNLKVLGDIAHTTEFGMIRHRDLP